MPLGHARIELVAVWAEGRAAHQVSHQGDVVLVGHTSTPLLVNHPHCCRHTGLSSGVARRRTRGPGKPTSRGRGRTHSMDRQVVRHDDVAVLRERGQIYPSSGAPQEQVIHSTASLADEMIVLAGLGVVPRSLSIQEERADFALLDETVKVAIHRGEADSRQPFVHPPVDLMGERMSVIALESFEHLFQLTCRTFAGSPLHRLPTSNPGSNGSTSVAATYQVVSRLSSGFPGCVSSARQVRGVVR